MKTKQWVRYLSWCASQNRNNISPLSIIAIKSNLHHGHYIAQSHINTRPYSNSNKSSSLLHNNAHGSLCPTSQTTSTWRHSAFSSLYLWRNSSVHKVFKNLSRIYLYFIVEKMCYEIINLLFLLLKRKWIVHVWDTKHYTCKKKCAMCV